MIESTLSGLVSSRGSWDLGATNREVSRSEVGRCLINNMQTVQSQVMTEAQPKVPNETVWLDSRVVGLLLDVGHDRASQLAKLGMVPGAEKHEGRWRFDRSLVEPWAVDHLRRRRANEAKSRLLRQVRAENLAAVAQSSECS